MLQVQEKAPQAAEEASRNINKGASEVCWSLALLSRVSLLRQPHTLRPCLGRKRLCAGHYADLAESQGRLATATLPASHRVPIAGILSSVQPVSASRLPPR